MPVDEFGVLSRISLEISEQGVLRRKDDTTRVSSPSSVEIAAVSIEVILVYSLVLRGWVTVATDVPAVQILPASCPDPFRDPVGRESHAAVLQAVKISHIRS